MRNILLAVPLAWLLGGPAGATPPERRIAVVLDDAEAEVRPELATIARSFRARPDASFVRLAPRLLADPIVRGRVLADLETRDLVVAVGDDAAEFAAREVAEVPVYFVDVSVIRGDRLASPGVSGMFSYNVDALLDGVKRLKLDRVGLAYTPGYEPVADWVRRGAAARGLALTETRIADVAQVAPAVRGLLRGARAIWLVGDPLLARGAGFEFLRERALSTGVAIIAPEPASVRRGALLAFEGPADPLTREAGATVDALLRGEADPRGRLRPAPAGGALLLNGALADKWKLLVPRGEPWRSIR
ncbi:MAG: hypothetical protein HY079_10930 [Elusimicrobia bacterium]|nr:hypothetical protein [Elusimicrobiota bacterium]